ncbi:MAG: hypothetical protein K1X28_05205 [Parachlamydiales bacterium]|nr:hypothetical protein [Parachlamydiales bacterium]
MKSLILDLEGRLSKAHMFLILCVLLVGNLLLKFFEILLHPVPYYFDQLGVNTLTTPWYTYMIPSMARVWGGTWSSLGIGLLPIMHSTIGNTSAYLLLNQIFIVTLFLLSWYVFRSKVMTITIGICAACTTLNNHVYENGSLVIIYIPYIFCFLNLFSLFHLFNEEHPKRRWWALWCISLLLYIASFEGWVDYYAIVLIVSPACLYILKKKGELTRSRRLIRVLIAFSIAFVAFAYFKINYGYASSRGDEHDLVINYGLKYFPLMIEDIISNFFTFFYMTIITYLPPQLTFSNSLLLYGPSTIAALQDGYDVPRLAVTNAFLLWRFYAGVFFSVFVYYLWKVSKKLFTKFEKDFFYLFIFMMMVLFGAAAHFLVKFRPMHIVPWLPYQGFIAQIGLMFLIGYLLHLLHNSAKSQKLIWSITFCIWASIIFCGALKIPFYKICVSYWAV